MEDLSLHILDIAENSINAGAKLITIRLSEDLGNDLLSVEVEDDGGGIPGERIREILDPFYTTRTTRKIGLGLSLLAQSARETGGDVAISSTEGEGTLVTATFRPSHIDMKPLGDIAGTLLVLIAGNPGVDFVFCFSVTDDSFDLDTREIRSVLGDIPLNSPDVVSALREKIDSSLNEIRKEVK